MELIQAAKAAAKALDDKFGKDIVLLEIAPVTTIADYFILATGGNSIQIQAMADSVEEALKAQGLALRHIEGMQKGNWVLIDFGDIIVHIFDAESREFYNLERIWGDAQSIAF